MRWLAILNPAAHNGSGITILRSLARTLHHELGAQCEWSTDPSRVRELARHSRTFEGLIAVGGDGTISEIVNSMNLHAQCLAILPAGTGNGLAHELHLPTIFLALQQLRQPRLAALNLIKAHFRIGSDWHERYIVHTSAFGYLAEVVALGMGRLKRLSHFRYAAAACIQGFRQQEFRVRLRIDEGPAQELVLTNLVVNNTRHAGSFCLFPKGGLQDGRLKLLYGRNRFPDQIHEMFGIVTQTYYVEPSRRFQAHSVRLDLAVPMTLMIDGELIPQVEAVRFQVVPRSLRCVVGEGCGLKSYRIKPSRDGQEAV